jgi:hypothetical protein
VLIEDSLAIGSCSDATFKARHYIPRYLKHHEVGVVCHGVVVYKIIHPRLHCRELFL